MTALLLALALLLQGDDRRPTITASPAGPVEIDGALNEDAWATADVATGFIQYEPAEGSPASEPTEVRVLRTADALVVAARMQTSAPHEIRQTLSRRDDDGNADAFLVAIDSYNDGRTAYVFGVTAAGVQFDALLEGSRDDASWDAVWESASRVGPGGWTAEIRIPYSQLRFAEGVESWGINFQRTIPARGEEAYWAPVTRAQAGSGLVKLFGRLDGLGGIEPRPVLQARPYTLAGATRQADGDRLDRGVNTFEGDVGADVKVGLSSNVTLDLTVNPDFGQVEADPAVLNLSTFETVFDERRPFFVEGTQIFDLTIGGGDGSLLYTRRIGAVSPIVAASKLTGRTARGLAFGALASVTGHSLRPGRIYGAARLRQEFAGQSYIGGGLTGFAETDEAIGRAAPSNGLAGAGDWALRFADGDWLFEGTAAAALRQQGERQDVGAATYIGLDKVEGYFLPGFGFRAYSPGFQLNDVGRFRQTDVLQLVGGASYLLNEGRPTGPFRRLRMSFFSRQTWTFSGQLNQGLRASSSVRMDLPGFQSVGVSIGAEDVGGVNIRETRGLGPVRNVPVLSGSVEAASDSRRRFRVGAGLGGSAGVDGGRSARLGASLDWTASDRLRLEVDAGLSRADGERGWAANEPLFLVDGRLFASAVAGRPESVRNTDLLPLGPADIALVDGIAPYVGGPLQIDATSAFYLPLFGARDTRQADISTRAEVLFGPGLSLQFYGQLFAARGRYRDFRLLADPDDERPFEDYPKRRDFALASFTANAVFRWEYRPASTLYVVWSQGREDGLFEEVVLRDDVAPSPFVTGTGRQLGDTFGVFPRNVLLVKLSYLLMR